MGLIEKICKDPFRIFFPSAIICLLFGSSLWIAFGLFNIGIFPVEGHSILFFGGFLSLAILGFLFTAIPRFTQTEFMTKRELFLASVLVLFLLFSTLMQWTSLVWAVLCIAWAFLIVFAGRRFIHRKQNPPYTFLFVGLGMLLGLSGSILNYVSYWFPELGASLTTWGKVFFYDGMVTAFIIGVGGRLIPGILGFTAIVKEQREKYESPLPFHKVIPLTILACALAFLVALFLEASQFFMGAYLIKALVLSYIAFRYWGFHRWSQNATWHGTMIKMSCWFIVIASWLLLFLPEQAISIKHLTYLGCYILLTMMVASRVIVAHSTESLDIEKRKFPYLFVGLTLAFAAVTRAVAVLIPISYIRHLGYAGLLLFLAALIWGAFFMKRTLNVGAAKKSS